MAIAASLSTASVQANTIQLQNTGKVNIPATSTATYTYDVVLTSNSTLSAGQPSGFTLYDVFGYTALSATFLANFAAPVDAATGGFGFAFNGDGAALNVSYQYTGTGLTSGGSPVTLGSISFIASNLASSSGLGVGSTDLTAPGGQIQNTFNSTYGPSAGGQNITPLPGALIGGMSLFAALGLAKLKNLVSPA
jgi:hypothetical protein